MSLTLHYRTTVDPTWLNHAPCQLHCILALYSQRHRIQLTERQTSQTTFSSYSMPRPSTVRMACCKLVWHCISNASIISSIADSLTSASPSTAAAAATTTITTTLDFHLTGQFSWSHAAIGRVPATAGLFRGWTCHTTNRTRSLTVNADKFLKKLAPCRTEGWLLLQAKFFQVQSHLSLV